MGLLPMTLYLWAYWRFIGGAWGATIDGASRRANLRAHRLPSGLWFPSLVAGLVGFAALLVNGIFFGLLHFGSHPRDVLLMLPYYVAVSAVYGGLTWAADSILPAVVLHSAGDVVVLTRWWATGRPEWQLTATAPRLVWEGGVDAPFVFSAIMFVVLAVLTIRAYRTVHTLRVTTQVSQPPIIVSA